MKIWIDMRKISLHQPLFFSDIISNLPSWEKEDTFVVYTQNFLSLDNPNVQFIDSTSFHGFFWEQVLFLNRLFSDKLDIFISFEETRPLLYNKNVIQILASLEKILYPNPQENTFWKKYSYLHIMRSNVKKAKKILCYHQKIKTEINERLNTPEQNIVLIQPFFYEISKSDFFVDIKLKHSLQWDYILYDAGVWNNHNLDRFLQSIKECNKHQSLYVLFLWAQIGNDLEIRQKVIDLELMQRVIFVWNPIEKEKQNYYTQSLWVVYPLLYNIFPFSLSFAVKYNCPILASESEENKEIFGNEIEYFSPTSLQDMTKKMMKFIKTKRQPQYTKILNQYKSSIFVSQLLEIIKK